MSSRGGLVGWRRRNDAVAAMVMALRAGCSSQRVKQVSMSPPAMRP